MGAIPSPRCGAGEGSRRRLRCSARKALEKGAPIDARARGRCCAACTAAVTCIIDKIASPSCIFGSSLNPSRPVSRHQRAIYMPPQKQAATLWPPPLDNFDYGPLPDERYTQALLAIRSIRYPVQPLRFGALVSPRSKFERLTRCYLENDGSGDVYDGPQEAHGRTSSAS